MTLQQAIDIVVARTGHERFRSLCDPSSPVYDRGYEAVVLELAGAPDVEIDRTHAPTLATSLAIRNAVRTCPWRDPRPNCGCEGLARCAIGYGDRAGDVSHADCWECAKADLEARAAVPGPRAT